MRKIIFILGLSFLVNSISAQMLTHTQGEILVQVSSEHDLIQLISKTSSLRRSHADYKPLSVTETWYALYFDYSKYDENTVLEKIRNNKKTIAAQFNHFVSFRNKNPNDSLFVNQWQWLNNGVNGRSKGVDTKAYEAWYKTTGGKTKQGREIVVAVIDDGTESSHPDLSGNIYINRNEIPGNGIDDDGNGYIDDYYGWNVLHRNDSIEGGEHGVGVNGLVGAKGNNITGVSGINWNIKMMNLKYDVAQGIKESDVIIGYSYVLNQRRLYNTSNGAKGAFVVATNASWGIDDGKAADAPLWCAIYDSLGSVGILNVSAADNRTSVNVDTQGDLPSLCPSEFLIPVTSISSDGIRAGAKGPVNIDLAAPGEKIYTTKQGGKYGFDSGTSFSAPIVTGAIGLLYANQCSQLDALSMSNPSAAALMVRNAILTSVDTSGSLKAAVKSGGSLNILKAMNAIQASCAACTSGALQSRIYIDSIVLDGLKFRSGDNQGYGDFTGVDSLTPSINQDGQVLLKVFPKAKDSIHFYYLSIWMDRNQDNDFNDTAELVWTSGNNYINTNIVSNIYLPITSIDSVGTTTLRISLKAVTNIDDTVRPTPCDFFTAGEVEDYSIKLLPKSFDCPDVLELVSATITEESAKITYQRIYPKLFYFVRYRATGEQKWDTLPTRDTMVMLT
ncbi:MAG: S8 family serine peptidase, partial [Saprospiraceae bacterium]